MTEAVTALVFDASAAAAGAAQFETAGSRVVSANANVVAATARTQSALDGMDRALARLQRQVDPVAAAQQRMNAQTALLDRALQRGRITADDYQRSLTLVAQKHDQAVAAASRAAAGVASVVASMERARAIMDRVNAATGVSGRSAEDYARRAADIAAYGAELDRLQAKYDPLFAAQQRYRLGLDDLRQALAVGAISQTVYAARLDETKAAFAEQLRGLGMISKAQRDAADAATQSATRIAAANAKLRAETMVATQTVVPNRAADVAAYGAELDRLRAKYNPLFAAQQQYRATLAEIATAERAGALAAREAAAARDAEKASFAATVRQINGLDEASGRAGRASSRLGQTIGQAGFQLQDFAVQVAAGQSALVALGQQGSQMLGVFGSGGAIAGAVLAIGVLVAQFTFAKTAVERFNETLDALDEQYDGALSRARSYTDALRAQGDQYRSAQEAGQRYRDGLRGEGESLVEMTRYYQGLSTARLAFERNRLAIGSGAEFTLERQRLRGRVDSALGASLIPNQDVASDPLTGAGPLAGSTTEAPDFRQATEALARFRQASDYTDEAVLRLRMELQEAVSQNGLFSTSINAMVTSLDRLMPQLERMAAVQRRIEAQRMAMQGTASPEQLRALGDQAMNEVGGSYQQRERIAQQRRDLQGGIQGQQAILAGAPTAEAAAAARQQIDRYRSSLTALAQQLEGLTPATEQYLRNLREEVEVSRESEGGARELAQADLDIDRAARAAGQGHASAAAHAEARRLVQERLNQALVDRGVQVLDQISVINAEADAMGRGTRAADDARIAQQANVDAMKYAKAGTVEYDAAVVMLTGHALGLRDAQEKLRNAREVDQQGQQIEMLRLESALVSSTVVEREREVAVLRERQRILNENGDPDSAGARARLENAARISDMTQALQRQRDLYGELQRVGEQAFDRIGGAITEAFANGSIKAIDFGNISKAVFSEVIQAGLRLAVIRPITNAVFGTNYGTLWDVGGDPGGVAGAGAGAAALAGGGGGIFSNLGNLLGLGSSANSILGGGSGGFLSGITGSINTWGASAFPGLFALPLTQGAATGAAAAATAIPGGMAGATVAGSELGIGSSVAGAGAAGGYTLMGTLGGIGAGFGVGSFLGSLTAGNSAARAQNGQIGAGVGALVGSVFGPIGSVVGGAIGGAGGGFIGPGPKTNAFGYYLSSSAGRFDAGQLSTTGNGAGGAEALAQAQQMIAQINAVLAAGGVAVEDMRRAINGKVNSEDQSATAAEAAKFFRFSSSDPRINTAVSGREFSSFDDLTTTIQQAKALSATLDGLAKPASEFQSAVDALITQFGSQIEVAQKLGFGEAELYAERDKQIHAVYVQRDKELEAARQSLKVAALNAEGRTAEAQAIERQAGAAEQVDQFRTKLEALGLTAEQLQPYVQGLTDAIAAQQRAAEDALREQQTQALTAVSLRLAKARAAVSGDAGQGYLAEVADMTERARQEIDQLRAGLAALGLSASVVEAQVSALSQAQALEAQAFAAAYQARRDAAARSLADRLFATTNDTSTLDGALAAYDRQAALERVSAAKEGLTDLVDLERVQAAERLKILTDFAKQAEQQTRALGGSIRAFLTGLQTTQSGYGSPTDRFTAAQAAFGSDLTLARGGNQDALQRITATAGNLLDAGRAMYGSTQEFQALLQMVTSTLENLPATQSYDQQILDELRSLGGAIDVQVEMAARLDLQTAVTLALSRIDQAEATAAAKADAERMLGTLQGAIARILLPDATSAALIAAAREPLSRIIGAVSRIAISGDVTNAARAVANAQLDTVIGQVSRILVASDVTDAAKAVATRALGNVAAAVASIAVATGVTDAARDRASAILSTITGAVASIAVDSRTTDPARTAMLVALGTITSTVQAAIDAPMAAATRQTLLDDFAGLTAVLGVLSDVSTIPEGQRAVLFSATDTITRAMKVLATGGTLTGDQRTLLSAQIGTYDRTVNAILTGNTSLTPDQRAILTAGGGTIPRTIAQTVLAPTGAPLITDDNVVRKISLDFSYAVTQQFAYLHNLADIRMFLAHIRDLARGAGGGVRVTTLQASGAANGGFSWGHWDPNSPAINDLPAGTIQNYGGLETGGWVVNGIWNRDSVIARFAGGGDIMLAGGEHVTNAPMAARYAPELNSINRGTYRSSNDNSEMIAELRALRRDVAALRAERGQDAKTSIASTLRIAAAAEATAGEVRKSRLDRAPVGARGRV